MLKDSIKIFMLKGNWKKWQLFGISEQFKLKGIV